MSWNGLRSSSYKSNNLHRNNSKDPRKIFWKYIQLKSPKDQLAGQKKKIGSSTCFIVRYASLHELPPCSTNGGVHACPHKQQQHADLMVRDSTVRTRRTWQMWADVLTFEWNLFPRQFSRVPTESMPLILGYPSAPRPVCRACQIAMDLHTVLTLPI
jgi:hypothetical protein